MKRKEFLLQLAEENDGMLTAELVVEAARPEDSPIHEAFEWDDDQAGTAYRLWQARQMIKVEVTLIKNKSTRMFRNVQVTMEDGSKKRGYVSLDVILDDEDLYKQTLKKAVGSLRYWQSEYKTVKELSTVINEDELKAIESSL